MKPSGSSQPRERKIAFRANRKPHAHDSGGAGGLQDRQGQDDSMTATDRGPCPTCTAWCATTERQRANRLRNMAAGGAGVQPYACPECGGIEWATTDLFVSPDGPDKRRSFLQRLTDR